MLLLQGQLAEVPIVSLQTGRPVAEIGGLVIEPTKLKLIGFYCDVPGEKELLVLPVDDIRQLSLQAAIIDHEEELVPIREVVRLRELADKPFELTGKPVVTRSKQKLGKVSDYVIDTDTWLVAKIHVKPPLLRNITQDSLVIARSAIVDVTHKQVVVHDATAKAGVRQLKTARLPIVAPELPTPE